MSKKPKKTSATVVLAVVLLFSGIAVIAASFGMQEWQIRQPFRHALHDAQKNDLQNLRKA